MPAANVTAVLGLVTPRGLGTHLVPDLPLGPSLLILPLSTWESPLSWYVSWPPNATCSIGFIQVPGEAGTLQWWHNGGAAEAGQGWGAFAFIGAGRAGTDRDHGAAMVARSADPAAPGLPAPAELEEGSGVCENPRQLPTAFLWSPILWVNKYFLSLQHMLHQSKGQLKKQN